jgi:hypothetical protein
MAVEYCDYCGPVDLDFDVEHWSEEEYAKGCDRKCKWEIEDDIQFRAEGQIKKQKENPPIRRTDPETGRDIH